MPPLKSTEFAEVMNVSRETLDLLEAYLALIKRWQKAVNLVGPKRLSIPGGVTSSTVHSYSTISPTLMTLYMISVAVPACLASC